MAKAAPPQIVEPSRLTCVCMDKALRVCQGDIFREIQYLESFEQLGNKIKTTWVEFPFIVVLTQDCDLHQDYTERFGGNDGYQDKHLLSVLVAPLYNYDHVRAGNHLIGLDMTMEAINSKKAPFVKHNEIARYHYLEFAQDEIAIPPSVIDFKHYFSLNVEYLKGLIDTHWVCKIAELYRESVSHRFASFLARIGLPESPNKN